MRLRVLFGAAMLVTVLGALLVAERAPETPVAEPAREATIAQAPMKDASMPKAPPPAVLAAAASSPRREMGRISMTHDETGKAIGSEGFGPHIARIAESGTPAAAMMAMQWLRACRDNEAAITALEAQRAQSGDPQGRIVTALDQLQAIARRCQTVTPDTYALLADLGQKSLKGGVEGAAATMIQLGAPIPDSGPDLMLARLCTLGDAWAGDQASILLEIQESATLAVAPENEALFIEAALRGGLFPESTSATRAHLAARLAKLPAPDAEALSKALAGLSARRTDPGAILRSERCGSRS